MRRRESELEPDSRDLSYIAPRLRGVCLRAMMRNMPTVAIHLISTTYGTWLPGDPNKPGHWSAMFDMYGRMTESGGKLNMPDETTFDRAQR